MSADLYEAALEAHEAGISVVPPADDGSKRPITAWKPYQHQQPTRSQLHHWFRERGHTGIAYVCGAVSGNLACLEFDDAETWTIYRDTAESVGLDAALARIVAGYCDETPSGGIHLLYRCPEIGRNTALARRPKLADEMADEHDRVKVLIETREEGGCVICAPSNGRVHPSGKPYVRLTGGPDTIATINPDERADLYELARAFDQMPRVERRETVPAALGDDARPGDDFNRRADWADILEPHGWVRVFSRGDEEFWRRPGKREGTSATTNYQGSNLLYIFTSSTEFEPEASYSKLGAYAVLEHGGDYRAAARALRARGFGASGRDALVNVGGFGRPREGTVRVA